VKEEENKEKQSEHLTHNEWRELALFLGFFFFYFNYILKASEKDKENEKESMNENVDLDFKYWGSEEERKRLMNNLKSEEKILRGKRNEIALKKFNMQRERKQIPSQMENENGNIFQDEVIEFIDELLIHGYKPIPLTVALINSFSTEKVVFY
jgi:hypothetical protein